MEEAPPADLDASEGELYRAVLTAPQARCALRWFSLLYEDAAMHQRLALLGTATSRMSFTMIADAVPGLPHHRCHHRRQSS